MLRVWLYRLLHHFRELNVLEGIAFRSVPSFPHLLIAVTTLIFQTPNASPLFVFTSLPILIDACNRQAPHRTSDLRTFGFMVVALFANSIGTSWELLRQHAEVFVAQTAFSMAVSFMTLAPVVAHRFLTSRRVIRQDGWEVGIAFGLLWAAGWWIFAWLSPFGRYGIPSCVISSGPLAITHKFLGLTGVDVLLGTTAYTAYQTGSFLLPVVQRQLEDATPGDQDAERSSVIDSGYGSPSYGSQGTGTMQTPPWRRHTSSAQPQRSSETSSLLSPPSSHRTSSTTGTTSTTRLSRIRGAGLSGIAITAAWLASTVNLHTDGGELDSLSASLSEQTPLGIGLVLPPVKPGESLSNVDALVHEAQKVGNSANLLVFPETALVARTQAERDNAVDRILWDVCKQYGVYVQLGVDSYQGSWCEEDGVKVKREGRINEVVLISPNGEVGCYSKQRLVPYVESYPVNPGLMKVPTWSLYLSAPPGVNKTDWTPDSPHIRTVYITPAICLDTFHPSLFDDLESPPDLFTVSASSPSYALGRHILGQAESLSLTHSVPVVLVASGSKGRADGSGISAVIDGWGRHLHLQRGGRSTVLQVSIPYGQGKERRMSGAWMGTKGVLGAGIALLMAAAGFRNKASLGQLEGVAPGRTDRSASSWSLRSLSRRHSRTSPLPTHTSLGGQAASGSTSGTASSNGSSNLPPRRSQRQGFRSAGYGTVPNTAATAASSDPFLIRDDHETPTPSGGRSSRGGLFSQ